ncbi:hypothetical protein ACE01N_19945 [Saccharicrinis sp. FJH2]|uniref:hypothetical protein n=1 Tax=Saccharicrinis sp. FJH65 TaxID=3344659 RepID=UPI0035F4F040
MKVILLNLLILFSVFALGQNTSDSIKLWTVDKSLIDNGEFKNYYQYDVGSFLFYNGRYENNLSFLIQSKDNHKILYSAKDTLSDAMILKPKFFHNQNNSLIIIMIEVAAEYSWGQKILMIKNGTIKDLGFLDYAVDIDNGESISEYCEFIYKQRQIQLIFKDVPIINWQNESEISGKDLIFEFCNDGIKKVKTK